MSVQTETVSGLPFVGQLPSEELSRVAMRARLLDVSPGQVVALEGEPCTALFFPVRGLLRARRVSMDGREQVLAYIGPGGCFNLVPALDGGSNVATLDALTEARVVSLACTDFRTLLAEHKVVAVAVSEYLATEVRRLSDLVESLALHTVRARLAQFLLDYAGGKAAGRQWTQEAIAAEIGTVREMVGRSLRAFADEGWLRRERKRLVVLDRRALEREAGTVN